MTEALPAPVPTARALAAQHFLEALLGPLPADSGIEVRLKRNDEDSVRRQFFTALGDIDIEGFGAEENAWFGVALRRRGTKTGKAGDLTWATCVWADFDHVEDKSAVVDKLKRFQLPPTMIVCQ